jgi:hypothetical protein
MIGKRLPKSPLHLPTSYQISQCPFVLVNVIKQGELTLRQVGETRLHVDEFV